MTDGCRKVIFSSRAEAKRARRRHPDAKREQMRPYFCDRCEGWHLGHLPSLVKGGWMTRTQHVIAETARRKVRR